jgi:hypothetical protein
LTNHYIVIDQKNIFRALETTFPLRYEIFLSDKPSPPKGPAHVEWRSDDCVELKWLAPDSDGGAAISDYIVERREVGKKSWKQVGTSTLCVIEIRDGIHQIILNKILNYALIFP